MISEKQIEGSTAKDVQNTPSESNSHAPLKTWLKTGHRKVDKHLLCWYAFVYLIMRIHVSNVSNTAILSKNLSTCRDAR